ncbi:hypothetical protein WAX74_06030 [Psychrobacillus sp. FJAT-51614]|uniref:Uncharacterized protein n=1 Tax=Psychrobacillus mangrovi TaxID=3117745 RepID=A0ABU8F2G2_9BACI
MGNIVITGETISTNEKSSFAMNTSFWIDLWDKYTNEFHEVVIHCWKEELDVIEELSPRAVSVMDEGLIKVLTINLNEENRLFFRNSSIDLKGGLKWFKMFFHVDGDERLEIGHYGSEIILYKVNEEVANNFVSIFSPSVITHYYDDYAD